MRMVEHACLSYHRVPHKQRLKQTRGKVPRFTRRHLQPHPLEEGERLRCLRSDVHAHQAGKIMFQDIAVNSNMISERAGWVQRDKTF